MTNQPVIRSFGLLLRKERRHGTLYIVCQVMTRRPNENAPLGATDGFRWEWPKFYAGYELDGLGIQGFVSDVRDDAGHCSFIGHDIEYRDVFSIDETKARRMAKTLKRVNAAVNKARAYEPGDKLAALAKALKLEWVVEDRERFKHDPDRRWLWMTIPEGRNHYRHLIAEAEAEETARLGGPKQKATTS
jgi:hypothetical protein